METTEQNEIFSLAYNLVNYTGCNLFLTGKAGTGKTTFLKFISENTNKKFAIVAPTGVAAINAGGVTIHSLFQLPLQNFLPTFQQTAGNANFVTRYSLFRGMRMSAQKINLLNELELLIIDEVSMVRSDMLDMIDETLRHFRRNMKPFGGVQVLLIGDLYQLPPVIKEEEWKTLSNFYNSPFFFSAKVLENNPLLYLELKKIYRQQDEIFIRILNNIRNTVCTKQDLDELNKRCLPSAEIKGITLVTHNYMADRINKEELEKLKFQKHVFNATVKGTFSEGSFPGDTELQLKQGARVMFIKNDSSGERKYYNGKLGVVKKINEEEILVELDDSLEIIPLEKEKWKNIHYSLNSEDGKIKEEEVGSFTQYPVRLAWAVTIHKSQGLTFDEVTIDAGKSFAAGQVYVALSRCRTLSGITLLSPVQQSHVISEKQIVDFARRENTLQDLLSILNVEKKKFAAEELAKKFDWNKIIREVENFSVFANEKQLSEKNIAEKIISVLTSNAASQKEVAAKFIAELEKKFSETPLNEIWLKEKVVSAKKFFVEKIRTEMIAPLNELQLLLKGKKRVKRLMEETEALENFFWQKIKSIESAVYENLALEVTPLEKEFSQPEKKKKPKQIAGESKMESLNFYLKGMTIEEIAAFRQMAVSTIEGHLCDFIETGEVNVRDFVGDDLLEKIKSVADKIGFEKLSPIKAELGDLATYSQIRMALNYFKCAIPE